MLHTSAQKTRCPYCGNPKAACRCKFGVSGHDNNFRVFRNGDEPLRSKALPQAPPLRNKRFRGFHRGVLFNRIWRRNFLKVCILLWRACISTAKWERKWLLYVLACYGGSAPNWANRNVVYGATGIFCRKEYIGETQISLFERFKTHLRCAIRKSQRMKLYRWLRKAGIHIRAWYPLRDWKGTRQPTKKDRMLAESYEVFLRQNDLNEVGRHKGTGEKNLMGERLITGRSRRKRKLIKFRKRRARQDLIYGVDKNEVPVPRGNEVEYLPLIMKLARRPWKSVRDSTVSRAVAMIRAMQTRTFVRLVNLAYMVLSGTSASIFQANLLMLCKNHRKVVNVNISIRNALLGLSKVENKVLKWVRSWVANWRRLGLCVIAKVTMIATRSGDIVSVLDNSVEVASMRYGEAK